MQTFVSNSVRMDPPHFKFYFVSVQKVYKEPFKGFSLKAFCHTYPLSTDLYFMEASPMNYTSFQFIKTTMCNISNRFEQTMCIMAVFTLT